MFYVIKVHFDWVSMCRVSHLHCFNAYNVFNVHVNPIEEGQMHHMGE